MTDWDPYRARKNGQEWRVERYRAGQWPSIKSVLTHFGRLSEAVAAAGLIPRHQGQHRAQAELALDDLTLAHLVYLRELHADAPVEDVMAAALRELRAARRSPEDGDLRAALIEVAGVALAWAQRCAAQRAKPRRRSAVAAAYPDVVAHPPLESAQQVTTRRAA